MHRNSGSIGLQPYHRPAPLAGTAVTVQTRGGDNLAILRAYRVLPPGRRDGDRCRRRPRQRAGRRHPDLLRRDASALAGMVLDGAIRDVAEIRERDLPGLRARRQPTAAPTRTDPARSTSPSPSAA